MSTLKKRKSQLLHLTHVSITPFLEIPSHTICRKTLFVQQIKMYFLFYNHTQNYYKLKILFNSEIFIQVQEENDIKFTYTKCCIHSIFSSLFTIG